MPTKPKSKTPPLSTWYCPNCGNTFYTVDHLEFFPNGCCYCLAEFNGFQDHETGKYFRKSGQVVSSKKELRKDEGGEEG